MYFESHAAVSCPEQLEHYTYMVAGCVGEFWTRLGLLAQGPGFSTQPEETLLLGQALWHGAAGWLN